MPRRELPADVIDVTGRPDLVPAGELFILCHPDGSNGLHLPRAETLHCAEHEPYCYIRVPKPDVPF